MARGRAAAGWTAVTAAAVYLGVRGSWWPDTTDHLRQAMRPVTAEFAGTGRVTGVTVIAAAGDPAADHLDPGWSAFLADDRIGVLAVVVAAALLAATVRPVTRAAVRTGVAWLTAAVAAALIAVQVALVFTGAAAPAGAVTTAQFMCAVTGLLLLARHRGRGAAAAIWLGAAGMLTGQFLGPAVELLGDPRTAFAVLTGVALVAAGLLLSVRGSRTGWTRRGGAARVRPWTSFVSTRSPRPGTASSTR